MGESSQPVAAEMIGILDSSLLLDIIDSMLLKAQQGLFFSIFHVINESVANHNGRRISLKDILGNTLFSFACQW